MAPYPSVSVAIITSAWAPPRAAAQALLGRKGGKHARRAPGQK
eukprot:CAMPEP_0114605732 /NCGR_PEP_ID=MMETSP0168-20121206/1203_1 /TAXON_ID=95228 ORGANISM="Vannella sp., Strain DIVA3 517/6/12" /NCGR_SAMPLE_ID=MMETSP0168 /ASSEMBLY_ACC=CAM_ASM_000044 /LENGTH=42 /DNA_ID= /DNA_START= /DNA_END= /DNA_ORIENTATION=